MKWLSLPGRSNELNLDRSFSWPEMTPQDWLMEIISAAGLVAMFVYIIYHYSKLPELIPVHFDDAGNPSGLGSRNQVWIIPGISLFIYFVLPFGQKFSMFLRSPRFLRRIHTQRDFNNRIRMARFQKMILILGFFYLSFSSIKLALHSGNGIGIWFFPVFLFLLIIPSLVYLILSK